jgi:homocitrate synthase
MCGTGENGAPATNGVNGQNGQDERVNRQRAAAMPYQSVGDFLSNTNRFKIIESTLREGEQFANAFFDTETKIKM